MMQGGAMAGGQLLNNAQSRNNGQQTGFLGGHGAIDGTSQSFYNLGDPFNLTGKASSGHAISNILDPGNVLGFNQAANPNGQDISGSMQFPNLGAASMIPQMPGGSFQPLHNGAGAYNNMAAIGAGGKTFNPSGNKPAQMGPSSIYGNPGNPMPPMMAKPTMPGNVGTKRK